MSLIEWQALAPGAHIKYFPGPRMIEVLRYVNDHPGCKKAEAQRCGSNENERTKYASSLSRLIWRGYVIDAKDPRSRVYHLYVSDRGMKLLEEADARALSREVVPTPDAIPDEHDLALSAKL